MCGFAGMVHRGGTPVPPPERQRFLDAMGAQLATRGPDDQRCLDEDGIALVFRRLSIVDVTGGAQPIWNEDRTRWVVVNGEIYNHRELRARLRDRHRWRTASDSEIALHLYEEQGPAMLAHLEGMFAIAIWDAPSRTLFLARDRLGIKPLYYCERPEQFLFGSELKALLAHPDCPREPCWPDLIEYRPASSYVKGVRQLPAGHYLLLRPEQPATAQAYWRLRDHLDATAEAMDADRHIATYGALLEDAVRKHLMSEVPVGVFLSGGLDSMLIAAIASRHQPDLPCFTMVSADALRAGDATHADEACRWLGLPFHPVRFDSCDLLSRTGFSLDTFEYFVWMMDAPRFQLEWVGKHELHRYAKTVRPDLKVMLLGQGADEFAGGYSNTAENRTTEWTGYLAELTGTTVPDVAIAGRVYQAEMERRTVTLQHHNLWHEDRTAARQGVESRVPFLDHRLVELLAGIPPQAHPRLFWNKRIVREAARRFLPAHLVDRPKSHARPPAEVYRLLAAICDRIYPAFRERHLEHPRALFRTQRLDRLRQAAVERPDAITEVRTLVGCMAMSVFDDLCRRLRDGAAPPPLAPPSPLEVATP